MCNLSHSVDILYLFLLLLSCVRVSPSAVNPSYIIVGAGVFGSSTAYHFVKAVPTAY